jgi:hypothetical protein
MTKLRSAPSLPKAVGMRQPALSNDLAAAERVQICVQVREA